MTNRLFHVLRLTHREVEDRTLARSRMRELVTSPGVRLHELCCPGIEPGEFLFLTIGHYHAPDALVCWGLGIRPSGLIDCARFMFFTPTTFDSDTHLDRAYVLRTLDRRLLAFPRDLHDRFACDRRSFDQLRVARSLFAAPTREAAHV